MNFMTLLRQTEAMETERKRELYRRFQGPLSVVSLLVCVLGLAFGYIYFLLGWSLYFDMAGFDSGTATTEQLVTKGEATVVIVAGVVILGAGYLGWRGFMRFAY